MALTLPQSMRQAIAAYQRADWAEAERGCRQVLNAAPAHFDALHLLGIIVAQTQRMSEAAELLSKAVSVNPGHAEAQGNLGNILLVLNRPGEALASFDRALGITRENADWLNSRGNALSYLNRPTEALDSYDRALTLRPDSWATLSNRGNALRDMNRPADALESYDRAIKIKPDFADALSNRGIALVNLHRPLDALESCDSALRFEPGHADALNNRSLALGALKRHAEALESCEGALSIHPDWPKALNNRGNALSKLGRHAEALASYNRAIEIDADYFDALINCGYELNQLKRYDAAIACYDRAIALKPDCGFIQGTRLFARMQICDWSGIDIQFARVLAKMENGEEVAPPLVVLALSNSPALQQKAAGIWVQAECPPDRFLPYPATYPRRDKIRMGYFSADFRNHPVSLLTAELFETHDKSRFELTAFSFGPDTQDEVRQRVEAAFDQFIDVQNKTDSDVALLARALEIDIAIDLGGHTQDSRTGIFALRAAPLQVSYIGYLGTLGAEYIDYLIADKTIIPDDYQKYYSEKIAYLPSYQANDSKRRISDKIVTRAESGLPSTGFVFCCFNNTYKITPDTFDGWMTILKRVEASVLWLFAENELAAVNLKKAAELRGVDPHRLVFGERLPLPEYLARYRVADLFLDTFPYNAGATASDALWAGLPVLTRMGETFASRVAASLLNAVHLPELITSTPEEYEARAIDFALNPEKLGRIRRQLKENRLTTPLFDVKGFTANIESAYMQMYEKYRAGMRPDHIYVHS